MKKANKNTENFTMVWEVTTPKYDWEIVLEGSELKLFCIIMKYMKFGNKAEVGVLKLVEWSKLSIPSVKRALSKLRELGYLISWGKRGATNFVNPRICSKGDENEMRLAINCMNAYESKIRKQTMKDNSREKSEFAKVLIERAKKEKKPEIKTKSAV